MRIKFLAIGLIFLMYSRFVAAAGFTAMESGNLSDSILITNPNSQNVPTVKPFSRDSVNRILGTVPNYLYIPFTNKDLEAALRNDTAVIGLQKKKQMQMARMFAEGKISMGYFNLEYNKVLSYNVYEGLKLGFGGETNRLLSKYFALGGYFSVGIKNGLFRHGEWVNIFPKGNSDLRIHLSYTDLNREFGGSDFLETPSLLIPEYYRLLLINNMYQQKRFTGGFEFKPFKNLSLYLFSDVSENKANQNTDYPVIHTFNHLNLTRTGIQMRYTPGKKLRIGEGQLMEGKAPGSDFFLTVIQGYKALHGDFTYTRAEFKGKFYFPFSKSGNTSIMVRGGIMSPSPPITELFSGYGSFIGNFTLMSPYSFATMRFNEFAPSKFSAVHLRHDLGPLIFPEKNKSRPSVIIAQNMGIGELDQENLIRYNLKDFRKGYYESGLEVNNLLKFGSVSWGLGIYFRYGPCQLPQINDNFAYKFGFYISI